MKLTRFAILTFSCLFSFSTFTSAHSTMFDDNYTFDDTNEGPSASLLMLFNEDFNLAAANLCTNGCSGQLIPDLFL